MSTHYVVSQSGSLGPATPIEADHISLADAVQAATDAQNKARVVNAQPRYIYEVTITPKLVVRQQTSVVTESFDGQFQ